MKIYKKKVHIVHHQHCQIQKREQIKNDVRNSPKDNVGTESASEKKKPSAKDVDDLHEVKENKNLIESGHSSSKDNDFAKKQ